ncbi:hypothetical protein PSN45_000314 [Yamadazyma tenuis]|uniref:Uncharacterized protein n=1 Tax=Candida tenuis (strain ATCC 10573 / BCRC 21748 / CBS 615 / JCM 9827 / NBRC 10315 / NRRL Y-1498 / VKM Y-70) TaxID=590646 RepID=G3B7K1_CANTC|nr:uncharacterized protein CANTEDRAFT_115096 [Yamadazyma tenuis ATCC 10573]EGV61633.1 hypothetical protein CANTEDRAFT_115096 [Yamadazyma tenuis ATCC 10573]WEJ92856.1 hypothetical protein PSN45_000314 [Yamadazyma tenuis]
MDFLNKGKEFLSSEQGKEYTEDAKEAYSTFQKTEGTNQEKAKAAYENYKKDEEEDKKKD